MTRLALLLLGCATACSSKSTDSAQDATDRPPNPHTLDDVLTWVDYQVLGTHNSTHIEPADPVDASHFYTHPPLDVQLEEHGVRGFELDVHLHVTEGWQVFHLPEVDNVTTCLALEDCLGTMKAWSDAHPWHLPLFVWIEPKDTELDDIHPDYELWDDRHDDLEQAVLDVIPRSRIFAPDDLRGGHASLPEALAADGPPTLSRLRDKFIFALLTGERHRDAYLDGHPVLEDRLMFVTGSPDEPWAAVSKINNAASDIDEVQRRIAAGFTISSNISDGPEHTEAEGAEHLAASLEAGAQILKVDRAMEVDGWRSEVPGGTPARCNPLTAPPECTAAELEAVAE